MPTIKENQLSGKTISYRFTVCLGRNHAGKQIRKRKKQEDWLMAQITAIMEKSLKAALDKALNDIFRD